jgi:hypothetical protein
VHWHALLRSIMNVERLCRNSANGTTSALAIRVPWRSVYAGDIEVGHTRCTQPLGRISRLGRGRHLGLFNVGVAARTRT